MDFAFMRDTFFTLLGGVPLTLNLAFTSVALGAVLAMLLALMRMSGIKRARLAGPGLCLRLPRHAAARADLPDLLRPRAVPPDPAGMGPVDLLPRALLVRGPRADPEHGGLCQRDHPRRPAIGAAQPGRGGAGLRHVGLPALPPHRLPDRGAPGAARLRQRDHPDGEGDLARLDHHHDGSDRASPQS